MRPSHSNLTPAVVHREAREILRHVLDWKPYGASVGVADLLDVFLLMAASSASLFAVVRRFFGFSYQTAWDAVAANLPDSERLLAGLLRGLYAAAAFSRRDRRRRWLAAIDTHYVPYYGRRTPHVVGGPKKQGTKWFFGYASAVLLHGGRRYAVGLCPLAPKARPHEVVRTLLEQVAGHGLRLRGVVLDSGFDSGETLLLLQGRGLAYTVPLRRKGNARNARNRLFEGRHRQVRWAEWCVKDTPRRVRTRTVLWKGGRRTLLLAFGGWGAAGARGVHRQAARQGAIYRRRFGIETSYRQKNQARPATTSRDPAYRLLLEGLGHLIRQLWVALTERLRRGRSAGAKGPRGAPTWVAELPVDRLTDWLFGELARLHPEELSIPMP